MVAAPDGRAVFVSEAHPDAKTITDRSATICHVIFVWIFMSFLLVFGFVVTDAAA